VCSDSKLSSSSVFSKLNIFNTGYGTQVFDDIAGVALNGVLILSSTSNKQVDYLFPKPWASSIGSTFSVPDLDACLGMFNESTSNYGYIIVPTCVTDSRAQDATKKCSQVGNCANDIRGFAMSSGGLQDRILGIAKDGHLIISPLDSQGRQLDCGGLDKCGGMTLSNDGGSYVYLFHRYYPYTMSCFGPAQQRSFNPSCTSNLCVPSPIAYPSPTAALLLSLKTATMIIISVIILF